jgi:hypothetical protein
MPLEDRFGLPPSPKSDAAATDYVAAVDLMLWGNAGAKALFDRALSAALDFALASSPAPGCARCRRAFLRRRQP